MLIPVLHLEEAVQINDLTRFNASKSIAVKGSQAINAATIKAGADATPISIFDADVDQRFLDWVFTSQLFDIDTTNSKLLFKVGSTEYSALVPSATYTLANLHAAIKVAIEAVASPLTVSFAVEKDNRLKLSPSDPSFSLVLNKDPASLFDLLQYKDSVLTSEPIEYSLRAVTLTVSSALPETASITKYIKVFTAISDRLFSADADLVAKERDILKWVADGRASFIAEHRQAQDEILEWLYSNAIYDGDGERLSKWSIVHTQELNQWATYKVLTNLFLSFSNAVDDVFRQKSEHYDKYQIGCQNKFKVSIDTDGDGKEDSVQDVSTASGTLVHS